MILAIGALDSGATAAVPSGEMHYRAARKALQRGMLNGGSVALGQGLPSCLVTCSGAVSRTRGTCVWDGRAVRPFLFGLHMGVGAGSDSSVLDGEMRLRIWWCVVILEAGCAVTFGRPHPAGVYQLDTAALPVNCEGDHLTESSNVRPNSQSYITLHSTVLSQSHLAPYYPDLRHSRPCLTQPLCPHDSSAAAVRRPSFARC